MKYHASYVHRTAIIATPNDAAGRARSGGTIGESTGWTRQARSAMTGRAARPQTFAAVRIAVTMLPVRTPT